MPKKMDRSFIIGTRGSLLAKTQCEQIRTLLIEKTGREFELKIIQTQGDLQTDKALWQMEGKDFFTKELDSALLKKEVDLVVHSYKDLGSLRPTGIFLAAISERFFAQDFFLIRQDVLTQMKDNTFQGPLIIGTSSPRRMENAVHVLPSFLPSEKEIRVECKVLRGNVNTRLEKLTRGDYHAIILAMAGLERLALEPKAWEQIKAPFKKLNWAILPVSYFPPAASQGALGIECRQDDHELRELLKCLHHEKTALEMSVERKRFQEYGGGCHLAVGIHARSYNDLLFCWEKGSVDQKKINALTTIGHEKRWKDFLSSLPKNNPTFFVGMPGRENSDPHFINDEWIKKIPLEAELTPQAPYFVTTRYAELSLENIKKDSPLLFAAGGRTWQKLAKKGHWFHGCADGLGHEEIGRFLDKSKLVKNLLSLEHSSTPLSVLTHGDSTSPLGPVKAVYEREYGRLTEDFSKRIESCQAFFWTSGQQAESYLNKFPSIRDKWHFSGPGKTAQYLERLSLDPFVLASVREYQERMQDILQQN